MAGTYLYECCLFFICVFQNKRFNRFLWFLAYQINNNGTLRKCYFFSCRHKNLWDIGIYLKPHFYEKCKQLRNATTYFSLTSANKPQSSLVLYLKVWSQSWPSTFTNVLALAYVLNLTSILCSEFYCCEIWNSANRLLSDFFGLLSSKNVSTKATWRNDFSSLLKLSKRYPLTRDTWPYCGFRYVACSLKFSVDQSLAFNCWSQAQVYVFQSYGSP